MKKGLIPNTRAEGLIPNARAEGLIPNARVEGLVPVTRVGSRVVLPHDHSVYTIGLTSCIFLSF